MHKELASLSTVPMRRTSGDRLSRARVTLNHLKHEHLRLACGVRLRTEKSIESSTLQRAGTVQ
eukprot:2535818-Prymnesium_polylepis.1